MRFSDQLSRESRSPLPRRDLSRQAVADGQTTEWSTFTKRQLQLVAARRKRASAHKTEKRTTGDRSAAGSVEPKTEVLMRSGVEIGSLYGLEDGLTHKSRTDFGQASNIDIRHGGGNSVAQLKSPKMVQTVRLTPTPRTRFITLENTTISKLKKARIDPANLVELEADCRRWLEELNIKLRSKSESMFENPLRNGYVLCMLASLVYQKKLKDVCREPRSVIECRNNIESALNILRTVNSGIPQELLWQTDEILKGNPQVIWQLIAVLKLNFEIETSGAPDSHISRAANLSSVNSQILPYTGVQISSLKNSLVNWTIFLGLFNEDNKLPTEFEELSDLIQKGALLSKLIQRVTGTVLKGIHHKPISKPNYYHNVLKCLDYLKTLPQMSRRFIWKVEPIVENNKFSILGLLEDFHRFSEGLPARKDPNYFADGPFLRRYEISARIHSEKKISGCVANSQISKEQQSGTQYINSARGDTNFKNQQGSFGNTSSGGMLQFKLPEDQKYRDRSRSMSPADLVKIIQNKPQSPEGFSSSGQALFFSAGGHQGFYHTSQNQQHLWSEKQTSHSYKSFPVEQEHTETQEQHEGQKHTFESAHSSAEQQHSEQLQQQPVADPKTALVVKILLLTNLPKVVERETWDSSIWTLFSDG